MPTWEMTAMGCFFEREQTSHPDVTYKGIWGRQKTDDSGNMIEPLQWKPICNTQAINSLVIPFPSPLHFPPGISDSDQLLHCSSEVHLMGSEMYEELPSDSALLCLPPFLRELKNMKEQVSWCYAGQCIYTNMYPSGPKYFERVPCTQGCPEKVYSMHKSNLMISKMSSLCC